MKDTILIFGDVCPAWGWPELFKLGDEGAIFNSVLLLMQKAEQVVINLECPLTDRTEKEIKTGPNLKAAPDAASVLKKAGVTAVSMANNHIRDFGDGGVLDTLEHCQGAGLSCFGAGKDVQSAAHPFYTAIADKRIGFLSFAEKEFNCSDQVQCGANCFDPYTSLRDIQNARSKCDYLVVLYHGGIEHYPYPSALLQKKCYAMVDSGADMVLCQHSHCIGTQQTYKNGVILYGQGNALFGYRQGRADWNQGLLVELSVDGDEIKTKLIAVEATEKGLTLGDSSIIENMLKNSEKLSDEEFLHESWLNFCKAHKAEYMAMQFARGRVFNKVNRMTNNLLVRIFHKKRMAAMNLIRCDAHREVMQTIFEQDFYRGR